MKVSFEIKSYKLDFNDPDSIPMSYPHPSDGRALRYHFDEFLVDIVPKLVSKLTTGVDLNDWYEYCGEDLLHLYLEQALYLELVIYLRALYRREFAFTMGWHWSKPLVINSELGIFLKNHLGLFVSDTIRTSKFLIVKDCWLKLRRIFRPFRKLCFRQNLRSEAFVLPMVAIELVEGIDPNGKNDAFWMGFNSVHPSRVILIVEPQNIAQFDINWTIKYAHSIGVHIISTDAKLACKYNLPYWDPGSVSLNDRSPAINRIKRKNINLLSHKWLVRNLIYAGERIEYFSKFFSYHNVAIYQHFTEQTTETSLRRIAAKRVNAIEVGKMRSQFFEWNAAAFHFHHQIAMVWNQDIAGVLIKARARTEYIIETGYANNYKYIENINGRRVDSNYFSTSVTKICVVFDNHPQLDNHFTRDDVEKFYDTVIYVADQFPELGLIVKSKKPLILNALENIQVKLEKLVNEGRCVVLNGNMESAAESAIRADIAVGVPCSTAACEAALLGCNVLIYDPSYARRFNEINASGVVFRDLDKFKNEFVKILKFSADEKSQEAFRYLLSPIRKESARTIAGRFFIVFLEARQQGKNARDSLNLAVNACKKSVVQVSSICSNI